MSVWLTETLVSDFNFSFMMSIACEPGVGYLLAHRIGMKTRIVYIFLFEYLLLRHVGEHSTKDLVHVGILWLVLELVFESLGSFAIGRRAEEILIGWNIFAGFMWSYVLATYLLSNLIAGTALHPKRAVSEQTES